MQRRQLIVATPAALALLGAGAARAQAFPAKNIRYICLLYTSPSPRD